MSSSLFFPLTGNHTGASFGHAFADKVELVGTIVPIGIGFTLLFGHTLFTYS